MGAGNWFRSLFCLKKVKNGQSKQVKQHDNGGNPEHRAAIRIQTAFRAYMAKRASRRLKALRRFNVLIQRHPIEKQTSSTLSHLHSWYNIQSQIRARRLCMVTEGWTTQRKLTNQMKLGTKPNGLEGKWQGGSETMEQSLSRIQQREEATVKRERAMAYAFSHQWRANASQYLGRASFGVGRESWGWSWKERWISARPWEVRVPSQGSHPKKANGKQGREVEKTVKSPLSNGKAAVPKPKKVAPSDGVKP
ncbi:hypothetical protein SLA2020_480050 [Shorea laevis]